MLTFWPHACHLKVVRWLQQLQVSHPHSRQENGAKAFLTRKILSLSEDSPVDFPFIHQWLELSLPYRQRRLRKGCFSFLASIVRGMSKGWGLGIVVGEAGHTSLALAHSKHVNIYGMSEWMHGWIYKRMKWDPHSNQVLVPTPYLVMYFLTFKLWRTYVYSRTLFFVRAGTFLCFSKGHCVWAHNNYLVLINLNTAEKGQKSYRRREAKCK